MSKQGIHLTAKKFASLAINSDENKNNEKMGANKQKNMMKILRSFALSLIVAILWSNSFVVKLFSAVRFFSLKNFFFPCKIVLVRVRG